MGFMKDNKFVKPKLPRKRKKAAIKAQGRKWYYDTIKLFYIDLGIDYKRNNISLHRFKDLIPYIPKSSWIDETKCKFWDNSSVQNEVVVSDNRPYIIPRATKYW